jgi:hypothetical protein
MFQEHIQEVLDKWTQIDDEIWAKVIVFERNRRVAKAYARAPVLTVNGSDDGFDGMRWADKNTKIIQQYKKITQKIELFCILNKQQIIIQS